MYNITFSRSSIRIVQSDAVRLAGLVLRCACYGWAIDTHACRACVGACIAKTCHFMMTESRDSHRFGTQRTLRDPDFNPACPGKQGQCCFGLELGWK